MGYRRETDRRTAPNNDVVADEKRAPYATPVFRAYGTVFALTMGMGGTISDLVMGTRMGMSDRMLKERIVRIGTHPLGFGLYLFDYKPEYRERWGGGRQFGAMADEVEEVMPQAVFMHEDGYMVLDYAMLGIARYAA